MKTIHRNITAALAAMLAFTGITGESRAANVTLDGDASYTLGRYVSYSPNGRMQSGRYGNFGADNYHHATIGIQVLTNRSGTKSGRMSFELWAMPFYGATSGVVLMTKGLGALEAGRYRSPVRPDGYAIFLNRNRFPELNLWELTSSGWRHRDHVTFTRKDLL
jgi:hypothetical protein